MKNIDYKIFVPRGENNYVKFDGEQIEINDLLTVNLHLGDDKVTYWLYFKIKEDDMHHKVMLKKGRMPNMILLIGNNPYEIHGRAEVIEVNPHPWENKIQYTISYTVVNASNTVNNPRKEQTYRRSELIDIRPLNE